MPTSRFTSTVKLYKVEDIGNGRFPAFSTIANQTAYFESKKKHTINNCKIVRGGGTVRVNVPTKSFYKDINYLSFVNPDYDNKTIYAFVSGYRYINDQCTELTFAVDYIQTFMFDVECVGSETVIDREHISAPHKTLATANPYKPALWEMDTEEPLPVATPLEERNYTMKRYNIGSANPVTEQAYRLFGDGTAPLYMYIVYISKIDFTELDKIAEEAGQTKPSDTFQTYIDNVTTYSYGFSIDFDGTVKIVLDNSLPGDNLISYFPNTCAIISMRRSDITSLLDNLAQWNCISSLVNVVVVPTGMLYYAFYNDSAANPLKRVDVLPETTLSVNNEKLSRFPFSYIRLVTPDGNSKELRYEYFQDFAEAQLLTDQIQAEIGIGCDIINGVSILAVPQKYKVDYTDDVYDGLDSSEIVVYSQFPTAPYNIDAYLTSMSALAAEKTRSDTLVNAQQWGAQNYALGAKTQAGYAITEGLAVALGGSVAGDLSGFDPADKSSSAVFNALDIPSVAKNIMDTGIAQTQRAMQYEANMTDAKVTGNAAEFLIGDSNGIFAQNYSMSKATYAVSNYVAPTGGGFENFTLYGWLNIGLIRVKLRDVILEKYDQFFDNYGYKSGRVGSPYIMKFIGQNSEVDQPSWNPDDETYVKTTDAHFKGTFQYVCDLWAQTFNGGIHWINGDNLIQGV